MGYIYMIWNDINAMLYIGKTVYDIYKRFQEHCTDCFKERNEKRPLYNAMKKYGIEHFHVRLVEECELEKLAEREMYWIQYYNTYHNGYNATLGGDGAQYVNYDVVCEYYLAGHNQAEIARMMNIDKGTVHNALRAKGIEIRDTKTVMQESLGVAVNQYHKKTGAFIRSFPSALSAAEYLGKTNGNSNGAASHITDVCMGKRNSAYGYKWMFAS